MLNRGYIPTADAVGLVPLQQLHAGATPSRFQFLVKTVTDEENGRQQVLIVTDTATGFKYASWDADMSRPVVTVIREKKRVLNVFVLHDGVVTPVSNMNQLENPRLENVVNGMYDSDEADEYNEDLEAHEPFLVLIDLGTMSVDLFNEQMVTHPHDLSVARAKLDEINTWVQMRYPSVQFTLSNFSDQPGLVTVFLSSVYHDQLTLCLYIGNHCVSSITCAWYFSAPHRLTMSLATHTSQQKKGWNKLCCAVLILIAKHIRVADTVITELYAEAINPVSAYMLFSFYNTLLLPSEKASVKNMTFDQLREYLETKQKQLGYYTIKITIPLSDANLNVAEQLVRYGNAPRINSGKRPRSTCIIQ